MIKKRFTFYKHWILANGLAEAIGLGGTLILAGYGATLFAADSLSSLLLAALLAILMGTVLEGVVVGIAQSIPLRAFVPEIPVRAWVWATAIGAGIAWMIGMIPSTLMGLSNLSSPESVSQELPVYLQYGLAVVLGLVTGPILGFAQWLVLRRYFDKANRWLIANALAWGLGMLAIFVGMDLVPWGAGPLLQGITVIFICFVAGSIVGAIQGYFLIRLIPLGQ
ncbi:hypothetical protein P2G88_11485 [Aliiglaciecola sp. CAU 1673]|uniref:hypothetical protein n=1 Tax=Aliiglaciecola sp. CAU 1673 TaxID=3032595 RepID=UPI0023DAB23B|nr:hypothetical protein [Aliiglaciecola sp. CAU 1673]MDF2178871.1 hypothetical protein [Aliiglaciecola sp. CAU 1673]